MANPFFSAAVRRPRAILWFSDENCRKYQLITFYEIEKDIVRLSDILGHSNINTTRIYIIFSQAEHSRKMESLGLII